MAATVPTIMEHQECASSPESSSLSVFDTSGPKTTIDSDSELSDPPSNLSDCSQEENAPSELPQCRHAAFVQAEPMFTAAMDVNTELDGATSAVQSSIIPKITGPGAAEEQKGLKAPTMVTGAGESHSATDDCATDALASVANTVSGTKHCPHYPLIQEHVVLRRSARLNPTNAEPSAEPSAEPGAQSLAISFSMAGPNAVYKPVSGPGKRKQVDDEFEKPGQKRAQTVVDLKHQPLGTTESTGIAPAVLARQAPAVFTRGAPAVFTGEAPAIHTDTELEAITRDLLAQQRNPASGHVEPSSKPEVWAETRTDLCETLPYFRAFQGGSYSNDPALYGLLFSDNASPRDYQDASVIVCRAGGGMEPDKDTKKMVMKRDQIWGTAQDQAKYCMAQNMPVAVIVTDKNPLVLSTIPAKYCVLGYFKFTDVWWEASKGCKMIRYRLERLKSTVAWWQPRGTEEIAPPGSLPRPVAHRCLSCHKTSEQIYLQGWMCLEQYCPAFWKVVSPTGELRKPEEDELLYDPRFLKKETPWPNDNQAYSLVPERMELSSLTGSFEAYSRDAWRGIVCPHCRCCIARLSFDGWSCRTPGCTFKEPRPDVVISARSVRDNSTLLRSNYPQPRDVTNAGSVPLTTMIRFKYGYRIAYYIVEGNGFVSHWQANADVQKERHGPDDMFEELQRVAIGLTRRRATGKADDCFYTRHSNQNFGAPYKHSGSGQSRSFEDANARCIPDTRTRMNWAAKVCLADIEGKSLEEAAQMWKPQEFNEVLALSYFQDQKISYHDDGEDSVGPMIGTLSLGSPATMSLRMKNKYYNGWSSEYPPLPGSNQYDKRLELYSRIPEARQRLGSTKKFADYMQSEAKRNNLIKSGNARPILDMELQHGDMVFMHGAGLQKFYEHQVSNKGLLRFSLTCRSIDIDSLPQELKPTYVVGPDMGVYDGSRIGGSQG